MAGVRDGRGCQTGRMTGCQVSATRLSNGPKIGRIALIESGLRIWMCNQTSQYTQIALCRFFGPSEIIKGASPNYSRSDDY